MGRTAHLLAWGRPFGQSLLPTLAAHGGAKFSYLPIPSQGTVFVKSGWLSCGLLMHKEQLFAQHSENEYQRIENTVSSTWSDLFHVVDRTSLPRDAGLRDVMYTTDGVFFLLENGQMYHIGKRHPRKSDVDRQPVLVEGLPADQKIVQIACGDYMTLVRTDANQLYLTGTMYAHDAGRQGASMGHHDAIADVREMLVRLSLPSKDAIRHISCGSHHAAVLCNGRDLYVMGRGSHGRLGLGDNASRLAFTKVQNLPRLIEHIVDVRCGSHHTILLDQDGRIYQTGWGFGSPQSLSFKQVSDCDMNDEICVSIAAGWNSAACVTKNKRVYTWGNALPELLLHREIPDHEKERHKKTSAQHDSEIEFLMSKMQGTRPSSEHMTPVLSTSDAGKRTARANLPQCILDVERDFRLWDISVPANTDINVSLGGFHGCIVVNEM
jgi:hypothetical protein